MNLENQLTLYGFEPDEPIAHDDRGNDAVMASSDQPSLGGNSEAASEETDEFDDVVSVGSVKDLPDEGCNPVFREDGRVGFVCL